MKAHEDCRLCADCGKHLVPEDQWPCLECGVPLCGSCECPYERVALEVCS